MGAVGMADRESAADCTVFPSPSGGMIKLASVPPMISTATAAARPVMRRR
ncbi:hypothetical protein [Streptomyces sp. NPDC059862]